jgi:hypothetical protein
MVWRLIMWVLLCLPLNHQKNNEKILYRDKSHYEIIYFNNIYSETLTTPTEFLYFEDKNIKCIYDKYRLAYAVSKQPKLNLVYFCNKQIFKITKCYDVNCAKNLISTSLLLEINSESKNFNDFDTQFIFKTGRGITDIGPDVDLKHLDQFQYKNAFKLKTKLGMLHD